MAKLKGPNFSIDARGKIGTGFYYSRGKSGPRSGKYFVPRNPRTESQQNNRIELQFAVLGWQGLPDIDKESWNQSAKNLGLKMSGYNYFIKEYLSWFHYVPPPTDIILDGLVSRWHLDFNIGALMPDDIGSNDFNNSGAYIVAGKLNNCLDFDGDNDQANLTPITGYQQNPLTVHFWIMREEALGNSQYVLFGDVYNNNQNWSVLIPDTNGDWVQNKICFTWYTSGGGRWNWCGIESNSNADSLLPLSTWVMVTVTRGSAGTPASAKMFINGVKINTTTFGSNPPDYSGSNPIYLAGTNGWAYLNCKIDEPAVYNRELSESEVLQNYNFF